MGRRLLLCCIEADGASGAPKGQSGALVRHRLRQVSGTGSCGPVKGERRRCPAHLLAQGISRLSKNLAVASDDRAAGELEGARPLARLAALPFPGLLRDGPPMARLRKLRFACICHRQRQSAVLDHDSPPLRKALKIKAFRKQHFVLGQNARRGSAVKKAPTGTFLTS